LAGAFSINVVGLDNLLKRMESLSEEVREEVYAEVEATAYDIAALAKSRVPKNMGQLSGAITVKPISENTYEVVAQKFYAPYVEFGTGAQAANYLSSQDEELKAYAMQFYVNGQGRMTPRPYFFPSFEEEKKKLIERLKNLLK
jgi:HK97 gp10 family phage protein